MVNGPAFGFSALSLMVVVSDGVVSVGWKVFSSERNWVSHRRRKAGGVNGESPDELSVLPSGSAPAPVSDSIVLFASVF